MKEQIRSDNILDLVVILGPTATGKTELAANVAKAIGSEIISADSRQVYRGMNFGTGKDYADYIIDGQQIPYHLIDILDAGAKYNVFEFQRDFLEVFHEIRSKGLIPILCGGTGMYIESVLNGYKLLPVPPNPERRSELEESGLEDLKILLKSLTKLHNTTDLSSKKRIIRAIEIAEYNKVNMIEEDPFPKLNTIVFGLNFDRETRRERITERLKNRLETGMIEEVRELLKKVSADDLIYYGLEYKFITLYCTGKISYKELFEQLNTAIHQFAKRQMTWFRKMEKDGQEIIWLDGNLPLEEKSELIIKRIKGV